MNPIIRVLSVFLMAVGAVLAFGVYRAIPAGIPKTITFVFLPLLHLGIGATLFLGKPTARPAAFFLAFFYVFLGVLSWNNAVSIVDFFPIVPLTELIPAQILKLNLSLLNAACFFVLPLVAVFILSLRSAGFSFEPFLKGRFSWSVPVSVLLAGAFAFSYSLLARSETAFFLTGEGRSLLSHPLSPFIGKILNYVEFCAPFIIAFAFLAGEIWAWLIGLCYGVYYWLSFITGGFHLEDLRDFKFLFFGTGWLLTLLSLEFSWPFFWKQEEWAQRREEGKRNWFFSILFLLAVCGTLTQAALLLFPGLKHISAPHLLKSSKPPPVKQEPISQVAPAPPKPAFRFEGTSIDAGGSYALINGELVKAGAFVDGFRVEQVETNGIILSKNGKKYRTGRNGGLKEI